MLPIEILNLARRAAAIALKDRELPYAKIRSTIVGRASMRGALFSSGLILQLRQLASEEIDIRAQLAWQAWCRVLATQCDVATTDLGNDLRVEIEHGVEEGTADIAKDLSEWEARGRMGVQPDTEEFLSSARAHAMSKVCVEIDCAILEAKSRRAQDPTRATFNFFGQVGAVLTGPGAAAHVTLGPGERQAVVAALCSIESALQDASELSPEQRAEVVGVVTDARAEVEKEHPNPLRVRALVSGIGMAVQTLASVRGAYDLLKGAAALIGLRLP